MCASRKPSSTGSTGAAPPSFACQRMSAAAGALLNNAATAFGDVAVMASVNRITSFANYLQRGIGQGFRSVLGYNL